MAKKVSEMAKRLVYVEIIAVIVWLLLSAMHSNAQVIFSGNFDDFSTEWVATKGAGHAISGSHGGLPGRGIPSGFTGYITYGNNDMRIGPGYGKNGSSGLRIAPEYAGITNQVGLVAYLPNLQGVYDGSGYEEIYLSFSMKFSDGWQFAYYNPPNPSFSYQKMLRVWQNVPLNRVFGNPPANGEPNQGLAAETNTGYIVLGISDDQYGGSVHPTFYRYMCEEMAMGSSPPGGFTKITNYNQAHATFGMNNSFIENQIGTLNANGGWDTAPDWHHYEFHIKLASAQGANNGVFEMWVDGMKQTNNGSDTWDYSYSMDATTATPRLNHQPGSNGPNFMSTWKLGTGINYITLWDNADNYKNWTSQQYVYLDNFVVSTHYSGPPPKPTDVTAQGLNDTAIKVKWSAGANGAAYQLTGYHLYYGTDPSNLNAVANVGNVMEFDVANLAKATQYYFAVAAYNIDSFGINKGTSLPSETVNAITVDTIPPAITINPVTSPTNSTSQMITGTITDAGGVKSVSVKVNGSTVEILFTDPTKTTWSYAVTGLTPGTNTIVVTGTDLSNNTTANLNVATSQIVLDTTPPSIATFAAPTYTNNKVFDVTFIANDNLGINNLADYCITTTNSSSGCTWNSTLPTSYTLPAEGTYTIYPWARDKAGNISASFGTPRIVIVDTTPPTITIDPVTRLTHQPSLTISGTVSSSVGTTSVSVKVGDAPATILTTSDGKWSTTISNFTRGNNTIVVFAVDQAQNTATKATTIAYPAGDMNKDNIVDIADALLALKISVKKILADAEQLVLGDIAPLVNEKPSTPKGEITAADALLILELVVGTKSF